MSKEQAVAEDKSEAKPSEETPDAQDESLDELLGEYDQEVSKPKQPAAQKQQHDPRVEQLYRMMINQETKKSISQAVETIKQQVGKSYSDEFIEAQLHGYASINPSIRKAYTLRDKNPKAWEVALKEVAKKVKSVTSSSSDDDDDAVAAAVRSASTSKPAPDKEFPSDRELSKMSDRDFFKFTRGL